MIGITRKEADCLAFIEAFHAREGIMPSRREMADGLQHKSTSRANTLVDALVQRGRLRRLPNRPRAIALIQTICCPSCSHAFVPAAGAAA